MTPISKAIIATVTAVAGLGLAVPSAWSATATATATAGRITTVAGTTGPGSGPGRTVPAVPCFAAETAGHVLFTDSNGYLRQLDPVTGRLTTAAGGGTGGDGSLPAAHAQLSDPCGLAVDKAGDIAIAESDRVLFIPARTGSLFGQTMSAGRIYTVATGFGFLQAASFDQAGNLVLADLANTDGIVVVPAASGTFYGQAMTAGDNYVIAGTGRYGYSGDGGPATAAIFDFPEGLAVDPAGNVLIADDENNRVRAVAEVNGTFYGIKMTAGDIYTIAGQHFGGYFGDGGPATAAELCHPDGLAFDHAGNLLVSDSCNNRIRVLAVKTGRFYGKAMKANFIYSIVSGHGGRDGGPSDQAGLDFPRSVTIDGSGNLLIADPVHFLLRVIAEHTGKFYGRPMVAGHVYDVAGDGERTLSGNGASAKSALLGSMVNIAGGPFGTLISAFNFPDGMRIHLVADRSGDFFGQRMTKGDVYAVTGGGSGPLTNGEPAGENFDASGLAADANGNALFADFLTRKIWVVAARNGRFYGQRMRAGRVYAIAGNGGDGTSGNGGLATKAQLDALDGVAVDLSGDVVITENDADTRSAVRVLVLAAATGRFYGRAMKAGHLYAVAGAKRAGDGASGLPALGTEINAVNAQADRAGNLLLPEPANDKIRVVARTSGTYYGQRMTAGREYVVAGDGTGGFAGDGGPATAAELARPTEVVADAAGNLLITDSGNNRIRVVAVRAGTFYGVRMTAGDIYTIAGNGTAGFAGDGGPAIKAELKNPLGVVATSGGALIADNSRLRLITG
jgi:hypothetical protein